MEAARSTGPSRGSGGGHARSASFSSTTTMNSSQQQPSPGRGHGDPSHITPFLPPLVTQSQGIAQNEGRPRKSAKAKMQGRIREDRRRELEEPRFNIAAPTSPRSRKPQQRVPRPPAAQTMVPFSRGKQLVIIACESLIDFVFLQTP